MFKIDLHDPQQFDRAYREHYPQALAAALGVLRDRAVAEEVVQEVFLHLWRRPTSFDPARGPLRTYLTVMARSRAVDRWRTRSVREASVERLATQTARDADRHEPSAADQAIKGEGSARLLAALDRVPRAQREAVLLTFGQGLNSREVAAAVGVPVGTAKSRLRLGLEKARAALETAA
jgi:RNA polymerase sigma-70 factor, ECF subfamily